MVSRVRGIYAVNTYPLDDSASDAVGEIWNYYYMANLLWDRRLFVSFTTNAMCVQLTKVEADNAMKYCCALLLSTGCCRTM
jgi:hypothetical protein